MHKAVQLHNLTARLFMPRLRAIAASAVLVAASVAEARIITVDSIVGKSATVTVGPGEYTEGLKFYYGKEDGGGDASAWDSATTNLAEVTAAGGTFTVPLPIDPSNDALCSRFALTDPYIHNASYIAGDGSTWFDTGIVNTSRDTVVMDYTITGTSDHYELIYGYRDSAFEKNISIMVNSYNGRTIADFTSTSTTSGTVPGRIDWGNIFIADSLGSPVRTTVSISADERRIESVGANDSLTLSNTEDSVAEAFECSGNAMLLGTGGSVPGSGSPASSRIQFHECRIYRDGELICDFIPVRAIVNGAWRCQIYDQKRHVFAACSSGNPTLLGYGATSRVAINSMSECIHSSSYVDLVATPAARGISLTADNSTAKDAVIYMTCNASDATADLGNWATVVKVADLAAGETLATTIPYPEGWGESVNAVRFSAYGGNAVYLEGGDGAYIDTGIVNTSGDTVELVVNPTVWPSNARAIYGCRNGANAYNISVFLDANKLAADFNNSDYNTCRASSGVKKASCVWRVLASSAKRCIEWYDAAGVAIGAVTNDTACADNFACAGNAWLFAANDMSSGTPTPLWAANNGYISKLRVYSLKVRDANGDLKCDIVPAKANGVAKAYDVARGIYLENAGTGTFSFGGSTDAMVARTAAITPADVPARIPMIILMR